MDVLELYGRAQSGFDAMLAGVQPDQWDSPSTCAGWTVRDVAGHVTWGQRQLRAWATRGTYDQPGGPGTPHPAVVLAGADPVSAWRAARAATRPPSPPRPSLNRPRSLAWARCPWWRSSPC